MPIYEYACGKCGQVIEVTQKITDPPLKRHNGKPRCGGKLNKLMSSNTFHLKGTGWYTTDYAKKETEPVKTKSNGKQESGDRKKTDTKKESTAEPSSKPKKETAKEV